MPQACRDAMINKISFLPQPGPPGIMEDRTSLGAAAHGMEQGQEVAVDPEGLAWSGVTGVASPPLFRLRGLWSPGETVTHLKKRSVER